MNSVQIAVGRDGNQPSVGRSLLASTDRTVMEEHVSSSGGESRFLEFEYDGFDRMIRKTLRKGSVVEDETVFQYEEQLDADLLKSANNFVARLGFARQPAPPYSLTEYSMEATEMGNPKGLLEEVYTVGRDVTGEIGSVVGSVRGTIYTKQYDGAGRLTGVNAGALKTAIAYDGFGRKSKISHSDGTTGTMDYDALNRMVSLRWKEGFKDSVRQHLTYDLAGNVSHMAREHSTYDLSYDPADQLVKSVFKGLQGVPGYNREFGYDGVGNRLSDSQNGTGSFVSNFLTQNGVSSFTASPDGFGEVAQEVTGDKVKNYTYRADGKIASFSSGALSVGYHYDGLDRLVAKTINDGSSYTQSFTHLANENRVLIGKAGDGSVITYIDGSGPLERLGEVKGGVGKGYITDHQGSVLNSSPAGAWKTFGPFGEPSNKPVIGSTAPAIEYGYAGYSFNRETGYYGTESRQFDSEIGRWSSQDSIGYLSGDSNYYRYVLNNPMKYTDPSGNGPISGVLCNAAREAAGRVQFVNNFNDYKSALDEINAKLDELRKQSSCLQENDRLRFVYEREIRTLEGSRTTLTAHYFASIAALTALDVAARAGCIAVAANPLTP